MENGNGNGPIARLPFPFGTRVYHLARTDRVVGIVTGYVVRPGHTNILVVWGDDLTEGSHHSFELTAEFEPSFASN